MNFKFCRLFRRISPAAALLLLAGGSGNSVGRANPTGGAVAQGAAAITASGPQVSVNQSSASALINWQSFNVQAGESVFFNQPSASSVTWNRINDPSASFLNGNLNANGYVVLQNPNGFTVGGAATINAHGLVLTTAPTPALNLASGGAWSFDTPPPGAKIVNYGRINITGGGAAFLIADAIENNGTISAPGGKIGLYAGQKVLVSSAPDGRGLSAEVTLPQGSVDNHGQLIADAGSIVARAQVVNQNGLVQANSVQNVNGTIELVAGDRLNLGANSTISAQGDRAGLSAGGTVVVKAGHTFSDQAGSVISIAGGAPGGDAGQVEISAQQMGAIQSTLHGAAAPGFKGGQLTIDPTDLTLDSAYVASLNDLISGGLSVIDLLADNNITLSAAWSLADSSPGATLNLTAGNRITLNSSLKAGNNWGVNLTAASGGVYLNNSAALQTQNGDLQVHAGSEVIVHSGAIRTVNGGNLSVTAVAGDVNTGNNINGFQFGQRGAVYYKVNSANLGGISTAAGGNVTINAGGDVISFLPVQSSFTAAKNDAGTGAFGSQPGDVTITAGGSVYGHYVLANGVGAINAGGNIGVPTSDPNQNQGFALSLINGSWGVHAAGNLYVQDVRNPNGIFGERNASDSPFNYAGYHFFDYGANASLRLAAGGSVEITGYDAPHTPLSSSGSFIPLLFPSSLTVQAGQDFILDTAVSLFPSANQNLNLSLGRDFIGRPSGGDPANLVMSDSAATRWESDASFSLGDHGSAPLGGANPDPVVVAVGRNLVDVNLYTTRKTHLTVLGDLTDASLVGENLHATDETTVTVAGQIYYSPKYVFAPLAAGLASANPLQPRAWDSVFLLAVNPDKVAELLGLNVLATEVQQNGLAAYLINNGYLLFPNPSVPSDPKSVAFGANQYFVYDPATHQLGFQGNMATSLSAGQIAALENGALTVLVVDAAGKPILDANNHLQVAAYQFSAAAAIATLYNESLGSRLVAAPGLQIGGPGQFTIHAGSINLGNSDGIGSAGFGIAGLKGIGYDFSILKSLLPLAAEGGAAVSVTTAGDLNMLTSGIYSRAGGNVTVNAGGNLNLSQGTFVFPVSDCYGIYTSGHSDVSVTAEGDLNVGSARIATFNGGDVLVESYHGDVNAGSGANIALQVYGYYLDPVSGRPTSVEFGNLASVADLRLDPAPYGSGILAEYPTPKYQTPGGKGQPGNIIVLASHGNVYSSVGGISQFALNGSVDGGPVVTVAAGSAYDKKDLIVDPSGSGLYGILAGGVFIPVSNIILKGGLVGGVVNVDAANIVGLIIARNDANINASASFSGTVLAGGSANFGGGGGIAGTVVGIEGISVSGGGGVTATLLSQNVSTGGGLSQSTLATSAGATASSQAAAQQSSQPEKQSVASNDAEDDSKKKKKPQIKKISRVTVLLSAALPPSK